MKERVSAIMDKIKEQIKNMNKATKVSQLIFLISIALFVVMFIGGGSFTIHYAMLLVCLTGVISAVISFVKKPWVLGVLNLLISAGIFTMYVYSA